MSSPDGDRLVAGTIRGVSLLSPKGGPPERLPGFEGIIQGLAFDSSGRRLAAGGYGHPFPSEKVLRVFDLETRREARVLEAGDGKPVGADAFLPDGRLLSSGADLRLWDVGAARSTLVLEGIALSRLSPDGRRLLGLRAVLGQGGAVGTAIVHDLERKETLALERHGSQVTCLAWDPAGRFVVTGSRDGIVRVGPPTGEEPHLLMGHEGAVRAVEVGPEGQWIASAGEDGTVRLWPLPAEGRPFHTLPYDELLGQLRSVTNFRVVPDRASAGGYRLDFEPLRGWNRKPPSW